MSVYRHANGKWYCRVWHRGKELRRAAGATKAEATAFEADFRKQLQRGPARTLDAALVKWLQGQARQLKSYNQTVNHARMIRPHIAGRPIEDAAIVIAEIREDGARRNLARGTVYQRCAVVRRLARLAWQWGWIPSPLPLAMPPPASARTDALSRAQIETLARQIAPRSRDTVLMLAYTGMRLGEAWEARKAGDLVLVPTSKNGRPRSVPIVPRIAHCPIPPAVTRAQFRADWDAARKLTGIRITAHGLRHTTASLLAQEGVPLAIIGEVLGHSGPGVTAKYTHFSVDHLRAAMSRIA